MVRLVPDHAGNYGLYDAMRKMHMGRILFDKEDNWIYDGPVLSVAEQEDLAGFITGHHKQMDELIKSL
jgi:hypothetical protein